MSGYVFANGRFCRDREAGVSPFDRGFLYGEGLFETLRAYRGRVFRLDNHVERLIKSARSLGIPLPRELSRIEGAIVKLLRLNRLSDARVRVTLSRGPGPGTASAKPKARLFITASRFPSPGRIQKNGVSAVISSIRRNPHSPLSRLKSQNYLECILARDEARRRKSYEAIFLDTRGYVVEGSTSNIFLVSDGRLITPSLEGPLLPGITRRVVLEIVGHLGIPVRQRKVKPAELSEAREVFLTNSLVEVLPAIRIEGKKVGSGRPGPVTRTLQKAYKNEVDQVLFRPK